MPGEPDTWRIVVEGELDIGTVTPVRECFADAVARGARRIVVDLSELRFMDSTGIALFLETAAQVPDLILERPSPIVRSVIELMGRASVLRVAP